jgi:cysteine desulfurase
MLSDFSSKIYLDYAATTPVDPRVLEVMIPHFKEAYGNPSSVHTYGQAAENAVENARFTMSEILNCIPEELIFTSCGSESDNIALRGVAFAAREKRNANHILISPVEHHAVSITAEQMAEKHGFELEYLPVNEHGQVTLDDVSEHIRPDTAIVSIIFANNEIGSINPIAEIGAACREQDIPFHTDAVQAAAHLPIDLEELNVDLMAFGAHKLYGPKGIGALYIRKGTDIHPTLTGGGQEFGMRAGTSNVPYIVGQAEAFRLAVEEHKKHKAKITPMRDHIIGQILENIPDARLTGHPTERLPNHTSFVFHGVDGNELLMMLDIEGYACSSGSACKTGNPEPSEVLTAIGIEPEWALGSLRVTLGHNTTEKEVSDFLNVLPKVIARYRTLEVG